MKKSITENRSLSFDQLMRLYLYPVYEDILEYMVDDDERIHFRGDTWVVIIDHSTGGFYFKGELHKYYSIDTIQAIIFILRVSYINIIACMVSML